MCLSRFANSPHRFPQGNSPKPLPPDAALLPLAPPSWASKSLQKVFKIQVAFNIVFHRFWTSKMAPKSTKNHSQEASKTLLEPTSCCKLFLLSCWLLFAPPGTSKMMVFLKGIIRFSKIQPFLKRPQKSPKMTPKWSQHGLPDASGELKMRLQILACFWVHI